MDEEILQDFLIEAGELVERLDGELVGLEAAPTDPERLNAVFRAFHTIKGGAGFLGLENLVAVSHKSEDIFDLLRKGQMRIDPALMDLFLQVLDVVRRMFDELRAGSEPGAAPRELLEGLRVCAEGGGAPSAQEADRPAAVASAADGPAEDPMARIVSEMHAHATPEEAGAVAASASDLITEDEFEAMLDRLHGSGGFNPAADAASLAPTAAAAPARRASPPSASAGDTPAKSESSRGEPAKADAVKETTVRVETETLDRIMNMVGELVLIRNRLINLQGSVGNEAVAQTIANLDVVTSDLQMAAMKTRMQPIKKVFGRFPRVVRDLARALAKDINLVMHGEDTDLDKNLVEALADPLVHLVRNAVDHGIEMPAVRTAAGKPASGTLRLAAEQAGDQIVLTIADDGKGIDAEALRTKVVEKGLMEADAAARLSQRECYELIFLPGFSTKEQISDISGRGVGMDVVKTRIAQVNGTIEIDSVLGQGTTIRIAVPLTLAILPTLMVVLGSQVFALPLVNVQEIITFDQAHAHDVDGRRSLVVRGKALPLFSLSHWLVASARELATGRGHIVVARVGKQSVALLVDELIGQEEVVIKPLGALLHGTRGLAGATITGDGKIALILDLPSLIDAYARR